MLAETSNAVGRSRLTLGRRVGWQCQRDDPLENVREQRLGLSQDAQYHSRIYAAAHAKNRGLQLVLSEIGDEFVLLGSQIVGRVKCPLDADAFQLGPQFGQQRGRLG